MKLKKLLPVYILLFFAMLSACKTSITPEQVDIPDNPVKKIEPLVGKKFILKAIERANGDNYTAPTNDMTLVIDSMTRVRGQILCRDMLFSNYALSVTWGNDGVLSITNRYSDRPSCISRSRFEFVNDMTYQVFGDYLYLRGPGDLWVAIFLQEEDGNLPATEN